MPGQNKTFEFPRIVLAAGWGAGDQNKLELDSPDGVITFRVRQNETLVRVGKNRNTPNYFTIGHDADRGDSVLTLQAYNLDEEVLYFYDTNPAGGTIVEVIVQSQP